MGKLTFHIKAAEVNDGADSSLLWTLIIVFVVSIFVFAGVWAIATALT